jgi:serine/threonine protein kinase
MSDGFDEGELRDARPSVDQVAQDKARTEIARRLFGTASEPHRMGRFVILERLGRGGMGVVYSAYDPVLDRRVALKLLRPRAEGDVEHMRARLHREAQALARLSHPNVVPVYDVGILGEDVFIVMEFVVGKTLRAWAPGRPWHEVLAAHLQAARGLAAAHAVGLVHRDVKPDNVMVGEDGRIRVLDFGLVRDYEPGLDAERQAAGEGGVARPAAAAGITPEDGMADTLRPAPGDAGWPAMAPAMGQVREPLTATAAIMGTPAYMAPEQLRGVGIGPKSDQFSFCVALYEALYAQHPIAREDLAGLMAEARALRTVTPDGGGSMAYPEPREPPAASAIPPAIWPLLRRGLDADPARRWPSMDALIDALAAVLAAHDRTLEDPALHRFHRSFMATTIIPALIVFASVVYANLRGATAEVFTSRFVLLVNLGMGLVGGAFLGYARTLWKPAKYLRRLLELFVVLQGGMVLNGVVSLWLARPLYENLLFNLVVLATVFALGSLMFARWMAWLLLLDLTTLTLCLLIPERHLLFFTSAIVCNPIVVLVAWNHRTRQLGTMARAPQPSTEET